MVNVVCMMVILILPDSRVHDFNTIIVFSLSAEFTVGYVQTFVTVSENDGVAQLTVGISMPPGADPIETSFFLLVNTSDGTATGLLLTLELLILFSDTQSLHDHDHIV